MTPEPNQLTARLCLSGLACFVVVALAYMLQKPEVGE